MLKHITQLIIRMWVTVNRTWKSWFTKCENKKALFSWDNHSFYLGITILSPICDGIEVIRWTVVHAGSWASKPSATAPSFDVGSAIYKSIDGPTRDKARYPPPRLFFTFYSLMLTRLVHARTVMRDYHYGVEVITTLNQKYADIIQKSDNNHPKIDQHGR